MTPSMEAGRGMGHAGVGHRKGKKGGRGHQRQSQHHDRSVDARTRSEGQGRPSEVASGEVAATETAAVLPSDPKAAKSEVVRRVGKGEPNLNTMHFPPLPAADGLGRGGGRSSIVVRLAKQDGNVVCQNSNEVPMKVNDNGGGRVPDAGSTGISGGGAKGQMVEVVEGNVGDGKCETEPEQEWKADISGGGEGSGGGSKEKLESERRSSKSGNGVSYAAVLRSKKPAGGRVSCDPGPGSGSVRGAGSPVVECNGAAAVARNRNVENSGFPNNDSSSGKDDDAVIVDGKETVGDEGGRRACPEGKRHGSVVGSTTNNAADNPTSARNAISAVSANVIAPVNSGNGENESASSVSVVDNTVPVALHEAVRNVVGTEDCVVKECGVRADRNKGLIVGEGVVRGSAEFEVAAAGKVVVKTKGVDGWRKNSVWANKPKSVFQAASSVSSSSSGSGRASGAFEMMRKSGSCRSDINLDRMVEVPAVMVKELAKVSIDVDMNGSGSGDGEGASAVASPPMSICTSVPTACGARDGSGSGNRALTKTNSEAGTPATAAAPSVSKPIIETGHSLADSAIAGSTPVDGQAEDACLSGGTGGANVKGAWASGGPRHWTKSLNNHNNSNGNSSVDFNDGGVGTA